jgi:hypothetical protein
MASDPIPELRTSLKAETDGDFRGPLRALRARLQEETDSQFAAVPAVVRNPIDGTGTAQQKPAEPLMAPSPHLTAPMAQRSNPVLTWVRQLDPNGPNGSRCRCAHWLRVAMAFTLIA